jgi:hypothetical protein
MTTTVRAGLVVPEVLEDAIAAGFAGAEKMTSSPSAVINGKMPPSARGGDRVKVPYFASMGELVDVAEGDPVAPTQLTMTDEEAVVVRSAKSFEITEWAQMAAQYADPNGEAGRQVVEMVKRRLGKALITAAKAALPSSMVRNVFNQTTPRTIDYDAVVEAKMLWGDEQDDIVEIACHSKTFGDMLKLKTADGLPLLTNASEGKLPRFLGMDVTVSDLLRSDHPTVVATGTTPPAVTIDGESNNADLRIEITTGGARGTAVFRYSVDGGANWATGITTAAAVVLGTSGLTANFATGTYATDNVYVSKPRHQTLVLKRGALVAWYNGTPRVKTFEDVSRDQVLAAINVYWIAYRYQRLHGLTKGGVVCLRHN